MIARFENDSYKLYNKQNLIIGEITREDNFKKSNILIAEKQYLAIHDKWTTKILENDELLFTLKTSPFFGTIEILETEQKIKGVKGFKWGTQLVDKQNNTLLKIRNESQYSDKGSYIIETTNNKVSHTTILLALYGHLQGSKMKQNVAIIVAIIVGLIVGFLFQI